MEFQDLKISVNGERILDLSTCTQGNFPLVEVTLGLGADSLVSKMEVTVAPVSTISSAQEDKNQKLIMTEELPSQSEIGSSSNTPLVDKNQRKNYL
ncbi:hypothetical protein MA16_Dca026054 [Dendrobium catenatum]|uniref:Uncharacterized protein n=1 Tax=Dendrobium catenatum TaxID=906689 RepID=A0A2I0WVW6_9ASPA|nr:hypothetical protein MA16_Dca026054 [Dendrobium catenatum]